MRRSMATDNNLRFLDFDTATASALAEKLDGIIQGILAFEAKHTARIYKLHRAYEISARNLLHYLALLRYDLFPIRKTLSSFGLSSLGRSESHVTASIMSVLQLLNQLLDRPVRLKVPYTRQVTYEQGYSLLEAHTNRSSGRLRHSGGSASW